MQETSQNIFRVALYARVSTEEQREGQTIESQVRELEQFSKTKNWVTTGLYKDEGWSGSMLARPELDRLRDDATKGLFEAVLINDVDRLARDVTHLGILKRDLERHGIRVIFRKLPSENSPTHNLLVNILGSFAEFEREMITDRTRRGRRHKVEVRKLYLGTNSPYGYRYFRKDRRDGQEGYLTILLEEANVVRLMYQWVDQEGLTARKVIDRLNHLKIKPRKGGKLWRSSSVLRILHNETYAGTWHYNKHEGCEPKTPKPGRQYRKSSKSSLRRRPKTEWLPVELPEHLRVVKRERWERVQVRLRQNLSFSTRNGRHVYLLSGLVRCGACRARYVGDPCHAKFYYRCLARCKNLPTIKEDTLNNTVWEGVRETLLNPDLIIEQVSKLQSRQSARFAADDEIKKAKHEINQIELEESRLLEAYRLGILSPQQLTQQLEQLKSRRSTLAAIGHDQESPASPSLEVIHHSVTDFCNSVARSLDTFEDSQRQSVIRELVNEVIFEGDRIRIRSIIPLSQGQDGHGTLRPPPNSLATVNADPESVRRSLSTKARRHDQDPATAGRIENTKVGHCDHNPAGDNVIEFVINKPILPSPPQPRTPLGHFQAPSVNLQ
jgi:site-specific DNA recombinase